MFLQCCEYQYCEFLYAHATNVVSKGNCYCGGVVSFRWQSAVSFRGDNTTLRPHLQTKPCSLLVNTVPASRILSSVPRILQRDRFQLKAPIPSVGKLLCGDLCGRMCICGSHIDAAHAPQD